MFRKPSLMIIIFLLAFASPALAAMEYYTYGGFDPVVIAFQNVARIFGDNSYKAFIVAFATLGISFGSIGAFSRFMTGQTANPISWFVPVAFGMTIYSSLFVRTDTLNIYDPVYNQTAVVGGLPVGAVYSAGVINKIERFIVELFDTTAPAPGMNALRYQDHGGAIGFVAMQNSLGEYLTDNKYSRTMMNYVHECVTFELVRPGTTLTQEQLFNPGNTSSLLQVIGAAANPANYTVSYVTDPTVGTPESCSTIYSELQSYYGNPANAQKALANACGSSNFADFPRCQQLLADAFSTSLGVSVDPAAFVSNNTIADITAQTLIAAGGASTAQYLTFLKQNQNAVSGGFLAGIMNPRMIDAYVAYSILLIPLLAMFIPTPMWQKALGLIISLMLWNMLLRALDVITFHMWATDYQRALASMKDVGMGIEAYMQLPKEASKHLGQYASMRNGIFLLASIISGALFKFGDSALSRLAVQSQSHNENINKLSSDRGEASKEAMNTVQNAQRAMLVSSLAAGVHGFDNIGRGLAAQEMSSAYGGAGKLDAAGGNVGAMAGMERQAWMARSGQEWGYTGGVTLGQALTKGGIEAAGMAATLAALGADGTNPRSQAYQNAYGATMDNTAKTMATKDVVDKWAKGVGISEKDAYRAYAAMDMANRQGVMKAWKGDVEGYSKFLENSQHLSRGERDAVMTAATAAGKDLRSYASDSKLVSELKNVGVLNAIDTGKAVEQAIQQSGTPRDTQAVTASLRKNLESGNFEAIKGDKAQAAAFGALVGKDAAKIGKEDMGAAREKMAGAITSQDLKDMGKAGILTEAGRMDQWQAVQQMTGMGPREATSFVGAHNEMKSIAGIQEAEKYAGAHNKNYMDLMRAGARSFRMDLSAQEAKQWGLGDKGGTIMVAMGQDGESVFVNEQSGHSFQRGTFGRSGTQVIEYDEHGKQVGNWTHRDNAYTSKDGRDIQHLDRTIVDKGLRSTIGNQEWRGNRGIFEDYSEKRVSGPDGMTTQYSWKDKAGHEYVVAGNKDGLMHMQVQKDGKAASLTIDPRTGETLLETTQSGKKDVLFAGRTEIQQGTSVTGAANAAAGKIGESMGFDREGSEAFVGTLQSLWSDVVPIAGEISSVRANSRAESRYRAHQSEQAERQIQRTHEQEQREQQHRVTASQSRTAKILQHQSKTSSLPRGTSPVRPR